MKTKRQNSQKNSSKHHWLHGFVLVFLKETYLFLKNLYGLIVHPFKTTGEIIGKPDKSQTVLVFGLPIYFWFFGVFVFLPPFWLVRNWYNARILSLLLFYSFTLLLLVVAGYLYFRLYQYYKAPRVDTRGIFSSPRWSEIPPKQKTSHSSAVLQSRFSAKEDKKCKLKPKF